MVNTNVLLTIGLSIVGHFCDAINLDPALRPRNVSDFQRYVVGSPYSSVDLAIFAKHGTVFNISDGVVVRMATLRSFLQLQDLARFPTFLGPATVDSNTVAKIGLETVRALLKSTNAVSYSHPTLRGAGEYKGQPIPFYDVLWPTTNNAFGYLAHIEIDARHGSVVSLMLVDHAFRDYAFARRISNEVYKPEPPPRQQPTAHYSPNAPRPTGVQVVNILKNAASLCEVLGVQQPRAYTIADVTDQALA